MTKTNNWIADYYQAITDGSIVAGKWIILLYKYIITGLEKEWFYQDLKKANRAVKFMENFMHHSKGPLAPQLVKLELWQKALVSLIFGIVDENGLRQFREVFIVMGRKDGKSLLASGIAEYEAYIDGGYGADVFFVAPKLDQADIVFSDFWQSVSMEPELKVKTKKRKSDIYIAETNTSIKKIAFSAKKSDGFNPQASVCDEVAAWQGDQGIKQYTVMTSALGARPEPLIVSITTANYINDGIYDDLMKRSTRFLLGDSKEKRLLPLIYMIDDVSKWNDMTELKKALPNLGVSVSTDYIIEEIAKAEQSLANKAEFMCKFCCIKQNSSQAWLDSIVVQAAQGDPVEFEDFSRCYCVIGIDLSQTRDLTSAVCLIQKDGKIHIKAHFWLPSERFDEASERDGVPYRIYQQRGFISESGENYVEYKDCYQWCMDILQKYRMYPLKVGYDRYSATYLVQELKASGFQTDDVYQGDNLWGVMQEFEGLMKDGVIDIGDNDLLASHYLNSAVKMSIERGRGKLVKIAPNAHIDGMAATLDAMAVRQKWWNEIGKQLLNKKKR